jgi:NADH dehydrogenase
MHLAAMNAHIKKNQILILGGGFGGLYAALEFERRCDPALEITLVTQENFFLFTPMLHEVAASDLDFTNIVNPLRKLLRHVRIFVGQVQSVDLEARRVTVAHGYTLHTHILPYDHLVLGLGSVTNFYGLPGLAERALGMKTLSDAVAVRNRLIANLEEADNERSDKDREPLLTIVVAGGGFTGVETIGSINDFLRETLPYYPNLKLRMLRLVLVHPGEFVLPELGSKLGSYATAQLRARGIEIHARCKVSGVTSREVSLSDGTVVPSVTLVWTAGTAPSPTLDRIDLPKKSGKIVVAPTLQVVGRTNIWALGDCALIPNLQQAGTYHLSTAQHASREGTVLARNLAASIRGRQPLPFRFKTIGQLASIGRRTGVARILGVNFSGFIAWWLWRTIYLSKLPGFEKKVRVALEWTLDLFFDKDIVQYQHSSPLRQLAPRDDSPVTLRVEDEISVAKRVV